MQKLINAYKSQPSEANKQKIEKHLAKHMMASCLLTPEEISFLKSIGVKP